MPADPGRDYPALLTERGGRFHLLIPELGLQVSDPSLEAAYARLEEARERYLAELAESGMAELLPQPSAGGRGARGRPAGLGRFAAKAGIVAASVAMVVLVSGWVLSAVVDSAVARLGMQQIGGREFWTGLEAALHDAGAPGQELAPEQQERLLESISNIVERARPFVEAVQPLFPARECVVRIEGLPQSQPPIGE